MTFRPDDGRGLVRQAGPLESPRLVSQEVDRSRVTKGSVCIGKRAEYVLGSQVVGIGIRALRVERLRHDPSGCRFKAVSRRRRS